MLPAGSVRQSAANGLPSALRHSAECRRPMAAAFECEVRCVQKERMTDDEAEGYDQMRSA